MKRHYLSEILRVPLIPIKVVLAGAGGTGSQVLIHLARINISLLRMDHKGLIVTVFDPDKVTYNNVGRQQYYTADIGRNKADLLVERINRSFGLRWQSKPVKFPRDISKPNIVISCIDDSKGRIKIDKKFKGDYQHSFNESEYCTHYWMDFGNSRDSGQFVLGSQAIKQPESKQDKYISKLDTVIDIFPDIQEYDTKKLQGTGCSTFVDSLREQDLFINTIVAAHGCKFLWKFLTNSYTDYQGMFYNGETETLNPILL